MESYRPSNLKGGPNQTVNQLTRRYPLVGMEQLCGLFGLTRQAGYAATRRQEKLGFQAAIVLAEVRRLRRQVAGLGTTKLYEMMQDFLTSHQIKLGRDRFHNLLKVNGLLLIKKRSRVKITDSDHDLEKYPNQVKELKPSRVGQLWVSDLSYIRVGIGFAYLSVIMDAYSRKIVDWSFHKTLEAKGPVAALEMALKTHSQTDQPLIHHSDRAGRPVPCSVLLGGLCGSVAPGEDHH